MLIKKRTFVDGGERVHFQNGVAFDFGFSCFWFQRLGNLKTILDWMSIRQFEFGKRKTVNKI